MSETPRPRRTALAATAVAVCAVLAYVPAALNNGFAFDDYRFILRNPHVAPPGSVAEFLGRIPAYFADPGTVDPLSSTGIVRPLRTLEFAVDRWAFGVDPGAFHMHSALWHGLAAALVCLLLMKLFGGLRGAVAGALVFALHPVQVESVAWISSRGDVAMGACSLAAVLLALRSRGRDRFLAASLGLGLIAMLYKETAVVLPLLVFAVRLARPREPERPGVWPALRSAAPWFAVSALYLVYRQSVMHGGYAHVTTHVLGGSTAGTFATMFRGFGFYVFSLLVPTRQALDWYLPVSTSLADPAALVWLAAHGAAIVTAIANVRRRPELSAAISLFYLPLIPVANWPFALGIPTAERFLYLPIIGLAALVAQGVRTLHRRGVGATAPLSVVCVGLATLTILQGPTWKDDAALWLGQVATHPTPRGSQFAAAEDLRDAKAARHGGDEAEARRLYQRALDHTHDAIDLWHRIERVRFSDSYVVLEPESNAANACFALAAFDHGLVHAREAVRVGEYGLANDGGMPPQPYYNLALLLSRVDRPSAALAAMQRAHELGFELGKTEGARFYLRLETALRKTRRFALARDAAERALAVHPESTAAQESRLWYDTELDPWIERGPPELRAIRLAQAGRFARADQALSLRPLGDADRIAWVHARHEGIPGPQGWRAARDAYDVLDAPEARYRQAVCEENLGEYQSAMVNLHKALEGAPEDAPWLGDARRALARLETGCPARRDHGLAAE